MSRLRQLFAAACMVVISQAGWGALMSSPYSQIVFIGDSLSDNGNVFAFSRGAYPPPPYVGGRFSNGPVAAEYMAEALGLSLADFAFGGAKTGPDALGNDSFLWASGLNGTGMQAQVNMYASTVGAAGADPSALFGVWGGPNDYFEPGLTPNQSVANLMVVLGDLYSLGARNFFVPNMPDLGLTAEFVGTPDQATMTTISLFFNQILEQSLISFTLALPDAQVMTFDTFGFLQGVVADPASVGLEVVADACLDSIACVLDPNTQARYLFWDGVHPTTAAHAQLGLAFAAAVANRVPEPSSAVLVALAFGLLFANGLRRHGLGDPTHG